MTSDPEKREEMQHKCWFGAEPATERVGPFNVCTGHSLTLNSRARAVMFRYMARFLRVKDQRHHLRMVSDNTEVWNAIALEGLLPL